MSKSNNYQIKKYGPITERRDYSNTKVELETQDFLQMQRDSFEWFLEKGIEESFKEIYPIRSNNGKTVIEYISKSKRIERSKNEAKSIE
ncbi:MAG: hypothetical protein ACRDCH_01940, partial [Metamycoplasmataceae bacterium]